VLTLLQTERQRECKCPRQSSSTGRHSSEHD